LKPQDIVILLKIIALGNTKWHNKDISGSLNISAPEVSKSLDRCVTAGLIDTDKKKVIRQALFEFIEYGICYVFPFQPGCIMKGIPTSIGHPFMKSIFDTRHVYVWPSEDSDVRGFSIEPLFPSVTKAVKNDDVLYKQLALVDVLRSGKPEEKKVAIQELRRIIAPY